MGTALIHGQHLADSFLALLPSPTKSGGTKHSVSIHRTGAVAQAALPADLKKRLPEIFNSNQYFGFDWANLFNGDKSDYNDDHSAADMALVGFMAREGLTPDEVDLAFRASALYRDKWDAMRGAATYGQRTIARAFEGFPGHKGDGPNGHQSASDWSDISKLDRYKPIYVAAGMPPRKFVGPKIGAGASLFPETALSTLVALGAVGKTSLLVSIGAHVAAGKDWNGNPVTQHKVAIFFCEEIQEEVNRKFSAIVDGWSPAERQEATENMMLVPLVGDDARLTQINHGQYRDSGVTEKLIGLLDAFGLKDGLVVIDHMQGFASGDLNTSETATSICREANKIVQATGAAVVFAAHISKANIKATELEQGFAVGSLAFENATRQMAGLLPMTKDAAEKYGLGDFRKNYAWLGLPKNSYGGTDAGVWLQKVFVPKYHTIVMEPVTLTVPISVAKMSANEKLADRIVDHITKHPRTTKSQLDGVAGNDGPLKASKERIRDVLRGLLDTGVVESCPVTDAERQDEDIPKQIKEILRVKPAKSSPPKLARQSETQDASADLKPALGEP